MKRFGLLLLCLTLPALAEETPLRPGWNAVAFPVPAVGQVTGATGVATYEGGSYRPASLTAAVLNEGQGTRRGFWIYTATAGNLSWQGANGPLVEFVDLQTGWNLVSSASSRPVTPAANPVVLPDFYEIAPDGTSTVTRGPLQPGRPYWIYATAATRLSWGTPITSLSVTPASATVRRYSTLQLQASAPVEWTSEVPSAVAVSASGLVTALFPGTYTVTARAQGLTATSVITVDDSGQPGPLPTPASRWTTQSSGTSSTLRAVTYGGPGRFVAVGDAAGVNSADGLTWTASTGLPAQLNAVGANANGFFAAGDSFARCTSTDGVTFTFAGADIPGDVAYGAASGNGFGMLVGLEFGIPRSIQSGNAVPFTAGFGAASTPGVLRAAAFGAGSRAVGVGFAGTIGRADVTTATPTWTASSSPTAVNLNGVAYGGTRFVAVGNGGTLALSTDAGVTFTSAASPTTAQLNAVTYGNGEFVAVGNAGTVLRSPDGTTWTAESAGTAADLLGVVWNGTLYVAVGTGGVIVTSP